MTMKRIALSLLALALVPLAACSGTDHSDSAPEQTSHGDGSWTQSYNSISELTTDSMTVVVGRVEGTPEIVNAAESGDTVTKSSIYQLRVTSSLKGDSTEDDVLPIRQLGTVKQPAFAPADAALLESGQTYVLFLNPFYFERGKPTGQYVITGEEGAFRLDGTEAVRTTTRDKLPTRLGEADLMSQVRDQISAH